MVVLAGLTGGVHPVVAEELPTRLLEALASEDFKQRESGQTGLLQWARKHEAAAVDVVWKEYRSSPDPEVRQRCLAVLRELIADEYLSEGPGFLGVGRDYGSVVPPGEIAPAHAVRVTTVKQGTPASRAGIQVGDMILSLDRVRWADESASDEFAEQIAAKSPGTMVKLGIVREGNWLELDAVLVRQPASLQMLRLGIQGADEAAEERAAIDAHFKEWLEERKLEK
jgi:hypothetical protein